MLSIIILGMFLVIIHEPIRYRASWLAHIKRLQHTLKRPQQTLIQIETKLLKITVEEAQR